MTVLRPRDTHSYQYIPNTQTRKGEVAHLQCFHGPSSIMKCPVSYIVRKMKDVETQFFDNFWFSITPCVRAPFKSFCIFWRVTSGLGGVGPRIGIACVPGVVLGMFGRGWDSIGVGGESSNLLPRGSQCWQSTLVGVA